MPGTNCANVPSSLALRSGALLLLPVALPPGCARLAASPDPTGSEMPRKTIGIVEVARRAARAVGVAHATMTSTLLCKTSEMRPGSCANEPFGPFGPAALLERFAKGAKVRREWRHRSDQGYARNPFSLLRPRGEWQRSGGATKNLDEIASSHCIPPKAQRVRRLSLTAYDYSRV